MTTTPSGATSSWADALSLSIGTFTAIPVRAPTVVDRRAAARSLVLSIPIGALIGAAMWAVAVVVDRGWSSSFLAAVAAVGSAALITRGLHLDGLADTADALGSGRSGAQALEVMRRSDIGPFGVLTIVLVLLTQVACLMSLTTRGDVWMLVVVVAAGRACALIACRTRIPAARAQGLGAAVAAVISRPVWLGCAGLLVAASLACALLPGVPVADAARLVAALLLGWLAAYLLTRRCVARFGGITGDVIGAVIETGLTVMLVVVAFANG